MASMSVIGIDFGNEACYIAVAKSGGIETIANDYSMRATPSYVAFSSKNRILGVAAKNQQVTNMKNTVYGFKRLLGRKYRDPNVQRELKLMPFDIVEDSKGDIRIKVNYLEEEHYFSPEQCLAMLLTKLKDVSVSALQTPINDCVISVPSYYTNTERWALLDAARVAGLNVLRLFNETTATALSYGIYKLPPTEETSRNVIFVDCGHSSLQVSAAAFQKGKLRMLASAADRDLGGRDIDIILADYFAEEFKVKYKVDAKTNARAYVRLIAEVEKIKKQMSANATTLPLNIECFMNDKDVRSSIKRDIMEELCAHLFARVETTLMACLKQSGLALDDIHSVEIVGGSTRIPAIKQLIEKVFGKTASTTLNQDESVSRGCALQCAMLSPAVRVRDFSVTDVQNFPITVSWDASKDGETGGEIEVFPLNHAVPFSKMLTFYRSEPFAVRAAYNGSIPFPDPHIGQWQVMDIRPSVDGKSQKVKVKVRVNLHGIMTVSSASLVESKESGEDSGDPSPGSQSMEVADGVEATADGNMNDASDPAAGTAAFANASNDKEDSDAAASAANGTKEPVSPEEGDDKKDKKKKVTKSVSLPIKSPAGFASDADINNYTEQEFKMIAADKQEKERADARNALEEYVYDLRGKLSSDGDLAAYILDTDRDQLSLQLEDTENWLYEDGEDCQRQVYQDRLKALKAQGEQILERKIEADLRPAVLEGFQHSLQLAQKAVEQIRSADPKYAHLTEEDARSVEAQLAESYKWMEQARQKLHSAPKYLSPPVTVAQIRSERLQFDAAANTVLNKPPPKAPTPPPAAPSKDAASKDGVDKAGAGSEPTPSGEKMDTS